MEHAPDFQSWRKGCFKWCRIRKWLFYGYKWHVLLWVHHCDSNVTEVGSSAFNYRIVIIGLFTSLSQNRRQVIIKTNYDHWHHMARGCDCLVTPTVYDAIDLKTIRIPYIWISLHAKWHWFCCRLAVLLMQRFSWQTERCLLVATTTIPRWVLDTIKASHPPN